MNVQDTVGIGFEKNAAQDSHEPGEDDERDVVGLEDLDGFAVEVFAGLAFGGNENGVQAAGFRARKAGCGFDVGNDDGDFRVQLTGCDVISNSFKIRTTPG